MSVEEVNKRQIQIMRENLRFLREQRGWSIRDLSGLSGISSGVLKRIEDGKNFGISGLLTLCGLYHIRPHEIFCPINGQPDSK